MTTNTAAHRAAYANAPILLSVRLMGVPDGSGQYPEWLKVIHAINEDFRARHGGFKDAIYIGAPLASYDWWAGGWCEEYAEFRVILREDSARTANVQAKTETAKEYLKRAMLKVVGHDVDENGMPS